jgi:competence protein ComEC
MPGCGVMSVLASTASCGRREPLGAGLPAFAPWAIVFLSLAVLSSVLWRTAILRATALPPAALGLLGAAAGPSFDMAVAAAGDAVALRAADGRLAVIGRGRNAFSAEQWLRADADGRLPGETLTKANCDKLGCVSPRGGRSPSFSRLSPRIAPARILSSPRVSRPWAAPRTSSS